MTRFVPEINKWLFSTCIPVFDHLGQIEMIVEQQRDVTEIIESRGRLKEGEENFRNFFETMEDIILVATNELEMVPLGNESWDTRFRPSSVGIYRS